MHRRVGRERLVDNAPRFLHIILAREQCCITLHGVTENAFIRVHLGRSRKCFPPIAERLQRLPDDPPP